MTNTPVETRSPFAGTPVALVATVLFAALMAVSTRYGYHRDELYFRLLGEQASTGYFDTPPLTPMVAKLSIALFGDNTTVIMATESLRVRVLFRTCEQLAVIDDGVGSWNEEQGKPILLCHDPVRAWPTLWPELRHYD